MTVDRHDDAAFILQREIFLRNSQGEVDELKASIKDLAIRFASIFSKDELAQKIKSNLESGKVNAGIQMLRALYLPLNFEGCYSRECSDIRWEIIDAYSFCHDAESTHWRFFDAKDRQRHLDWAKEKVRAITHFVERFEAPPSPPARRTP